MRLPRSLAVLLAAGAITVPSVSAVPGWAATPAGAETTAVALLGQLTAAPLTTDRLDAGASLMAGQSLVSTDGAYSLLMQSDGNAVVYRTGAAAVFSTGTVGNPGAHLTMQTDGNLVVYSAASKALWFNRASSSGASVTMQTDGNLVEYGPSGALWSSKGGLIKPPPPPLSGPTLAPGHTMYQSQQLTDGGYRLTLQAHGNLVEYAADGRVVWSSKTSGLPAATFTMQGDGNAVLYSGGVAHFSTGTSGHPGARLTLGADGNVVVYDTNNKPLFATGVPGH